MRITSSYYPLLDAVELRLHILPTSKAVARPVAPGIEPFWRPMCCPACGNRLRVPADTVGKVGRCRARASEFLIPAKEEVF